MEVSRPAEYRRGKDSRDPLTEELGLCYAFASLRTGFKTLPTLATGLNEL